jgi:hypothetical protein
MRQGLTEDHVKSLIENINIHCFKQDLKAEEFVNIIINKSIALSENIG